MVNIVRYKTRKLFNNSDKAYTTLEKIAAIVENGQDVSVVDHATKQDITAETLTAAIMEKLKLEPFAADVARNILRRKQLPDHGEEIPSTLPGLLEHVYYRLDRIHKLLIEQLAVPDKEIQRLESDFHFLKRKLNRYEGREENVV